MLHLETELKQLIIEVLNLEGKTVDDIRSDQPLFVDGLGLDSIDALELGIAIKKRYGIVMSNDAAQNQQHFSSVSQLAHFIAEQKKAQAHEHDTVSAPEV